MFHVGEADLLSNEGAKYPHQATFAHSLNAAIDLIRGNKFDLVIAQEDIPVSAETSVVQSFIGGTLVAVCLKSSIRLALMVREDSPLHDEDVGKINLKTPKGEEVAYVLTLAQLEDQATRKGVEFALFKTADPTPAP